MTGAAGQTPSPWFTVMAELRGAPWRRKRQGWAEGCNGRRSAASPPEKAFEGREQFRREYRLQRHDGVYRSIVETAAPLLGEGAAFAGHVGSCVDITELRDTETVLKANEERYRSLVVATTSIVWTTDVEGAFIAAQPRGKEYTGQSWVIAPRGGLDQGHPPDGPRGRQGALRRPSRNALPMSLKDALERGEPEYRYFVARGYPSSMRRLHA